MRLKKTAQGMVPEKIVQIIIVLVVLVVLLVVVWMIFSDKAPRIWENIVEFMRFGP